MNLGGADVDAHPDQGAVRVGRPGDRVPAGPADDPVAEHVHHLDLFGHGDEFVRGDQAAQRVVPADKGLAGVYPAAVQVDDRLVEQGELVVADRLVQFRGPGDERHPQVVFQFVGLARLLFQLGSVAAVLAPGPFRPVQGHLGGVQQAGGRGDLGPGLGNADAHTEHDDLAVHRQRPLDKVLQEAHLFVQVLAAGENQAEVVAMGATDQGRVAEHFAQSPGHQGNDPVGQDRTDAVVDVAEAREFNGQGPQHRRRTDPLLGGQAGLHAHPVKQPGEGVEVFLHEACPVRVDI